MVIVTFEWAGQYVYVSPFPLTDVFYVASEIGVFRK